MRVERHVTEMICIILVHNILQLEKFPEDLNSLEDKMCLCATEFIKND